MIPEICQFHRLVGWVRLDAGSCSSPVLRRCALEEADMVTKDTSTKDVDTSMQTPELPDSYVTARRVTGIVKVRTAPPKRRRERDVKTW